MKQLSENFKSKMIRLSGVDLLSEANKQNIFLIKESAFLSEEEMLDEGMRTLAVGLLTLLNLLMTTAGAQNTGLKNDLLKTNLKNKAQVEQFKQKLESELKPEQVKSADYVDFVNKLSELQKSVGTTHTSQGVKTHYTDVIVNESNLSFDLTNPESKAALESIINNAKKMKGTFIVSIDTLKQMIQAVPPTQEVKLNEKIKVNNQSFKSYNDYKADEAIVNSIAQQIIERFDGFKNVYGYILVHGSASNVPTTAFGGDNDKLANARACSLGSQLEEKLPAHLKGKIQVDWKVNGPEYEHDSQDTAKYQPFQFSSVDISLAAVRSLPVVNTPEKITVKVKILNVTTGVEQNVSSVIMKSGKSSGKGSLQTSCPLNFNKK